jgi:ketosteroid isomerase-like protein
MGAHENLASFHRMWDAYATGRLWAMLDQLAEGAEWCPVGGGHTYVGHEQIRAWAEQVNRRYKSVTVVFGAEEAHGDDCVLATGHAVMYDMSGNRAVDTDVAWVCEFGGDAQVTRMTAFAGHDAARAFVSARSATPSRG